MTTQQLPKAATRYLTSQQRESRAALAAVQRQARRLRGDALDASWRLVRNSVLAVLLTAQERITEGTGAYIAAVMEETGQPGALDVAADVAPRGLVGVAGSGVDLSYLVDHVPVAAKLRIEAGAGVRDATRYATKWLNTASSTLLSDTARQSEALHMAVRPTVTGYVRMLVPPSCSRCAVLAGKRFKTNQGFQRHPGCDCRHIPASEGVAGDLALDPRKYFDSLPESEQDRIFTKAGAEAIRNGADMGRVVNARSGMKTSQVAGRTVKTTTVSRRRGQRVRLMPESIIAEAKGDRVELLRLLRLHGYII